MVQTEPKYRDVTLNGVSFKVFPAGAFKHYLKNHKWAKDYIREYAELVPGFYVYIGHMNKDQICKAAGMAKIGQWDTAVPEPWLDKPENRKRWRSGDWAVWFYPRTGKGVTFGRPVWSKDIWKTVKILLARKLHAGR